MRGILDPKHQKKALHKEPPKYSQVGEIIAGAADPRSSRLSRKERKRTMLDEAISSYDQDKLHTKASGIRKVKASGRKAFYQGVVAQRRKGK